MNLDNDSSTEDILREQLLTEYHEADLDQLLDESSQADFDDLLLAGRTYVREHRASTWSIMSSAAELGFDLAELGKIVHLSSELLQKLDLRLLQVATIPERVFDMVADALMIPADFFRSYAMLPPAIPVGTRFHAESGEPQLVLESFEDALRDDDDLSEADKSFWLRDTC